MYQVSQPLPCACNSTSKPTTRRCTPVCHNSSQATVLDPGRAVTSFPIIMPFPVPAMSISNLVSLTSGDPGCQKLGARDGRPCITRRLRNAIPFPMCILTSVIKHREVIMRNAVPYMYTQHSLLSASSCPCPCPSPAAAVGSRSTVASPPSPLLPIPRPHKTHHEINSTIVAPSQVWSAPARHTTDALAIPSNPRDMDVSLAIYCFNQSSGVRKGRPRKRRSHLTRVSQSALRDGKDVQATEVYFLGVELDTTVSTRVVAAAYRPRTSARRCRRDQGLKTPQACIVRDFMCWTKVLLQREELDETSRCNRAQALALRERQISVTT